ncbi:hydrolase, partial [bacterium]
MMDRKLLLEIYKPSVMQRWNDHLRPVDFYELDKQAHKMIVAYILGKFEEANSSGKFNWIKIIEGGLFEFFQRLVVTDLKPSLFSQIKKDKKKYRQLNNFVIKNLTPLLSHIQKGGLLERFKDYLKEDEQGVDDVYKKILKSAH